MSGVIHVRNHFIFRMGLAPESTESRDLSQDLALSTSDLRSSSFPHPALVGSLLGYDPWTRQHLSWNLYDCFYMKNRKQRPQLFGPFSPKWFPKCHFWGPHLPIIPIAVQCELQHLSHLRQPPNQEALLPVVHCLLAAGGHTSRNSPTLKNLQTCRDLSFFSLTCHKNQ